MSGEEITEYAIEMPGGSMQVRWDSPVAERIYPLAQWIAGEQRSGHKICRRRVIVVEDWTEVPPAATLGE